MSFLPGGNSQLVKKLLGCVQHSENNRLSHLNSNNESGEMSTQWIEKAIKSIVKKLKKSDHPGAAENLERAISNRDSTTDCVTFSKSQDGRVQFSHRKMFPHLLTARLWRWPDLENHCELEGIVTCKHAFHPKKEEICINPYHYNRVEASSGLAPIIVPKGTMYKGPDVPVGYDDFSNMVPNNADVPNVPSPIESVSSAGSYPARSPPPEYMSENESMDQDADHRSLPSTPSSVNGNSCESELVEYAEPRAWCTIHYYELTEKVGDAFHATVRDITIDGFTDPSNVGRFCLGVLSNINRNHSVEMARRHIGKGLRLYYIGGEVFAECLSDFAIFVQSPNANQTFGWHPATVVKVPPSCNLKIFSNAVFAQLLSNSVHEGYDAVYTLTRMCTIRVSFVKGWGTEYRRQTVMATPCWIEIHLNGPLQWLDRILKQMTPAGSATSVS